LIPTLTYLATTSTGAATHRVETSWEWYVIRAAGFVAAGLLILLMISGICHVTVLTYRFIEPVKAWALHKAMALALCAAIFIHVLFLWFDHFVSFSFVQLLVPFMAHYNTKTTQASMALGGLAISFGILAAYGVIIIVLSSLGWIDSRKKTWRWLHYLGYVVFLLIFLHGLYIGSDLKYGLFRTVWIAGGLIVLLAALSRLLRAGSLRDRPRP